MFPIHHSCYWLAHRAPVVRVPLTCDKRCDIAVIAGGFTGLWTALSHKELSPSTEIAWLKRKPWVPGASGRNAGMLSETSDHSQALAIRHFGWEEARRLAVLGEQDVSEMIAWLKRNLVTCELERVLGFCRSVSSPQARKSAVL